jgi:hypothetical protein
LPHFGSIPHSGRQSIIFSSSALEKWSRMSGACNFILALNETILIRFGLKMFELDVVI